MLGVHVHKGKFKTTYDAINESIAKLKINTVQIYTHGPQSRTMVDIGDVNKLDDVLVYVHATYISSPWNGNPTTISHIEDQLKTCSKIRAEGLVIHLRKDKIENIMRYLRILLPKSHGQKIILEAPAMKSNPQTYESSSKLNILISNIRQIASPDQIGICIDTSHITSGGVDFSSHDLVEKYFSELEYPEYISLIHLNGTIYPLGSGCDCHQVPFSREDIIWSRYKSASSKKEHNIYNSGVAYIAKFCLKYNIPMVLEVNRESDPGDTPRAIKLIKKLLK